MGIYPGGDPLRWDFTVYSIQLYFNTFYHKLLHVHNLKSVEASEYHKTCKTIKVRNIQKLKKCPSNYWLPWQQDSEENVEANLERLPINF